MREVASQFLNLGISLFIATFVWRYYRNLSLPQSFKYKTFAPRFWTGSIDGCVLWPIAFGTSILLTIRFSATITALLVIIQNLTWLIYTVYMHAKYGQTFGKMVCKVKVVDFKTEQTITVRQAILREAIPLVLNSILVGYQAFGILTSRITYEASFTGQLSHDKVFWTLSIVPLIWFIIEIFTMLSNKKRRALHDYIAGTVVIRTNA